MLVVALAFGNFGIHKSRGNMELKRHVLGAPRPSLTQWDFFQALPNNSRSRTGNWPRIAGEGKKEQIFRHQRAPRPTQLPVRQAASQLENLNRQRKYLGCDGILHSTDRQHECCYHIFPAPAQPNGYGRLTKKAVASKVENFRRTNFGISNRTFPSQSACHMRSRPLTNNVYRGR